VRANEATGACDEHAQGFQFPFPKSRTLTTDFVRSA
jgi:hypothetical protein